jgi:hypothetical protein
VWHLYRANSGLTVPHAVNWWLQYTWKTFWLYRYARPH